MRDISKTFWTFSLVLVAISASSAQIKLDPRLGAMRSIWIDAGDDLSVLPDVVSCFPQALSATSIPLTITKDKQKSQVVFRFRQRDRRIELAVSLHDGQQMWSVSAPLVTAATPEKRECAPAVILAEQLRLAMKSATEGTWYQPSPDPAQEVLDNALKSEVERLEQRLKASPQPLQSLPPSPPRVETQYDVMSASYQITEVNRVFWRFSWKMSVKNYGPDAIVVSPTMEFKNRGGYVVNEDTAPMTTIRAQDTVEITGMALIDTDIAPMVTAGVGRARRIR
jgi:hypothetical protein